MRVTSCGRPPNYSLMARVVPRSDSISTCRERSERPSPVTLAAGHHLSTMPGRASLLDQRRRRHSRDQTERAARRLVRIQREVLDLAEGEIITAEHEARVGDEEHAIAANRRKGTVEGSLNPLTRRQVDDDEIGQLVPAPLRVRSQPAVGRDDEGVLLLRDAAAVAKAPQPQECA